MGSRQDKRAEAGRRLDGLRTGRAGSAEPSPDPHFRAMLRERLVTAAGHASDDHRNEAREDGRNARSD
ncbi:hypothetical protein F8568_017190 [Actinomadura sp. LD22]|uniref:Uncharacterized protein n=1 Tax=Actinomadura physcomitrii TaxID=2650748 RepID=A0A6I4MC99_9ACTN|nr:hypothetical protein [Actinomadura physcomitrii]MWA02075.1 hypothetical protein [Actinomadura physcomitrii]